MSYIFKQKLNINDLAGLEIVPHKVLVHEPEEYLAGLYGHFLNKHNFHVKHSASLSAVKSFAEDFKPNILIFNIDSVQNLTNWLLDFKKDFPQVYIITIGFNTNSEILKVLLGSGVSSHINRKLSRPQDLVVLAQAILNN